MSLKNLIALQKQKAQAEPTPKKVEPEVAAETSAPTPESKPKGLGLNLAGNNFKRPTNPLPTKTPAAEKPKPKIEDGEFSLEDLASLDAADFGTNESSTQASEFDDEIEASAPDRELPADMTADMVNFVESLDGVYQVLHDPEMFGQAVRLIMIELQENPEYERLLSDPDIHVMIRGMRRTMGLARVNKQSKSRKASTNKNARKKAGVSDDVMKLLDSLMGGSDD